MNQRPLIDRILDAILPRRRALAFCREIEAIKADILADGRVDYSETTRLLKLLRPYARRGDTNAVKLEKLLVDVRDDGRIDTLESELVIGLLDLISERFAQMKGPVAG